MTSKRRSASSSYWLHGHFSDKYVQLAWRNKLRSRAWFKLAEIQKVDKIFKPKMTVIDLGSSPGGWSQYAVKQVGKLGRVVACDFLPMTPIIGVDFIKGDFRDKLISNAILKLIGSSKVQVIMSDMAPNMCGISVVDISQTMYLAKLALEMCKSILEFGGSFIIKIFHGEDFEEYISYIRYLFTRVKIRKPDSSRTKSREIYIIATGYKL